MLFLDIQFTNGQTGSLLFFGNCVYTVNCFCQIYSNYYFFISVCRCNCGSKRWIGIYYLDMDLAFSNLGQHCSLVLISYTILVLISDDWYYR